MLADVAAHPLVEDRGEEAAVVLGPDAAVGHGAGAAVGGRRLDLDDRDELDVARAQLVAEEAVDLERVRGVGGVDGAEDVELDAVPLQEAGGGDARGRRPACRRVVPVGVVQLAWAVDAEAHEVVVLGEERRPLVVEQHAVGLDVRSTVMPGGHAAVLDRACPPEEVEPHERRLAALPGEGHVRHPLRRDGLRDVGLHHLVGHAEVAARIERVPSRGRSSSRSAGCSAPRWAWP